ncbi:hypothetical protein BDV93DRAFT_605892 [Ceratobasidium sp. AG-I]|nr:hypothetical protein BDV93DRAFT_605892 [Ceratobasidium sp. AG-I]
MLRHDEFSACVFVDGVEVEYFNPRVKLDDSVEGREVMHAYIVGEPGKNFTVSWKDHRGIHASSGHIYVDGKDVASAIMRRGRGKPVSRSGAKVSATKLRPFKFAHLNITSDDTIADKKKDKEALKEMSTIRLAITYVELGTVVPFQSLEVQDWGPVHEEAKALGLTTQYDPKIEIPASRAVASRPLNPNRDGPDVQFVFTYATRDHLMAAEIVPNPNAPSLPRLAKQANVKNPIVLQDEDDGGEPTPEPEVVGGTASGTGAGGNASTPVPPRSPSKRPRNNKRASSNGADEDDEPEEGVLLKRAKRDALTHRSSPDEQRSSPDPPAPVDEQGSSPGAPAPAEDDDEIAELQRHMDEYNLKHAQGEGEEEDDVENAMKTNEEESQDL